MDFYLAPMESLTGFVFRNVYRKYYDNMDKYFNPFLAPTQKKVLKTREQKEVAVKNNLHMHVVPQILTNQTEHFVNTCVFLAKLGYREVNLNLGCPSPTVVTKKKGAGFLENPEKLQVFFEEVFEKMDSIQMLDVLSDDDVILNPVLQEFQTPTSLKKFMKISLKTRIGIDFVEEFEDLIGVYNRFDFSEIIVHPRLQSDFYKNKPRLEAFRYATKQIKAPLCYNGDIFTKEDFDIFVEQFPDVDRVMLGRGCLANPGLVDEIKCNRRMEQERLKEFHDSLLNAYMRDLSAPKDVLFKMKEMWFYWSAMFLDAEKGLKRIRKANSLEAYQFEVEELFRNYRIKQKGGFN